MYEELVADLRARERSSDSNWRVFKQAADAIEELNAKMTGLQFFMDNISKLPDCNTCMKKDICEFTPKYGEYCRINCPAWLGVQEPPKEESNGV